MNEALLISAAVGFALWFALNYLDTFLDTLAAVVIGLALCALLLHSLDALFY